MGVGLSGRSLGPKIINDSNGLPINVKEYTATFDTAWVGASGARFISFWIVSDRTAGSGTFDFDVECSPDSGTTIFDMPQALDSTTVAEFDQFGADKNEVMTWQLPANGGGDFVVRLEATAASSPTNNFTIYYSLSYEA